jgi:hypothetical protein
MGVLTRPGRGARDRRGNREEDPMETTQLDTAEQAVEGFVNQVGTELAAAAGAAMAILGDQGMAVQSGCGRLGGVRGADRSIHAAASPCRGRGR